MSRVITADAFDALADLDAESVHAIVTDPPYGLAFMGRDWDDFEPREYQEWCERWASECLRVLKPGGHLLAFSGDRTHDLSQSGIRFAGFEIRPFMAWIHGQGFPKALDVSKAIDKQRDDEAEMRVVCRWLRERINESDYTVDEIAEHFDFHPRMVDHWAARDTDSQPATPKIDQWGRLKELLGFGGDMDALVNWLNDRKGEPAESWNEREVLATLEDYGDRTVDILQGSNGEYDITAPATDAAREWDGWKTALKPAIEPITCARKPFEGTVAENVQAHGTGALNIDGCRIETDESWEGSEMPHLEAKNTYERSETSGSGHDLNRQSSGSHPEGRYPANVIFDAEAAERLDREVGETSTPAGSANDGSVGEPIDSKVYGGGSDRTSNAAFVGDSGGPSRFYYTSKATRAERTLDGKIENAHPTVKPIDLMEWLVRLVTAEGQHVLDPFAGTGTTGRAAKNLGREFTLIEQSSEWADVARARCGLTPDDPSRFTPDGQTTLTGD